VSHQTKAKPKPKKHIESEDEDPDATEKIQKVNRVAKLGKVASKSNNATMVGCNFIYTIMIIYTCAKSKCPDLKSKRHIKSNNEDSDAEEAPKKINHVA
jgi:hypothetical protein